MGVILDSQLLVLLVVGVTSRKYIGKHKRLSAYTADDFDLLCDYLTHFQSIVATPNTLTETSNLLRQIGDPIRSEILTMFRLLSCEQAEERYVTSISVMDTLEFVRLGLTDSALLMVATESHHLLTADFDLYLAATQRGLDAVNFNHLREQYTL